VPKRSTACAIAAVTSSALVTSAGAKDTDAPSVFTRSSPAEPGRSRITALPPLATIARTVASPSPDAPPVTRATTLRICMPVPIAGSPAHRQSACTRPGERERLPVMLLEGLGQPLHTRALSITLAARADGKLDVHGAIVDLRKRGLVPVAGDLQGCGIVHDMRLAGVVEPSSAILESITAEQRSIAFEPCAATEGESCRDPVGRIAALAGSRLDASWSPRLGQEIGGPRGCSHLLTLGHVLGSTTARALERERALYPTPPQRYPGQRIWKRDLVIDGHEPAADASSSPRS
jgi:hypothetical protein